MIESAKKDRGIASEEKSSGAFLLTRIEVNQSAKKTKATLSVWWLPKADRPQKRLL